MKKTISVQDACDFLNRVLNLDPYFAHRLFIPNFPMNEKLWSSDLFYLGKPKEECGSSMDFMAIINCMFEKHEDGVGQICAKFDDNDNIVEFKPTRG